MLPEKTADIQLAVYGDANPYRRWERVKALWRSMCGGDSTYSNSSPEDGDRGYM